MNTLKVFALAALLAGTHFANAQTENHSSSDERDEFILKAGINITDQNLNSPNVNAKGRGAFHGGFAFNLYTGARGLSIQPELNFIGKGAKLESEKTGNQKFRLGYLELPVLVKYRFGIGYINAGPSLGLRLGNARNLSYGPSSSLDFGLQMGAGLAIPAGSGKIIVDGRYGLGLTDVAKENQYKAKNRNLNFGVGYAFPISK